MNCHGNQGEVKVSDGKAVTNGDRCVVVAGTHKGKSGLVQDRKASKSGEITITVLQDSGERFKTLARSVERLG